MARKKNQIEEMRELVSNWRTSGAGKKSFCSAHSINIHTFTYWVEKLEKLEGLPGLVGVSPISNGSGFIALKRESMAANRGFELRFPQGAILRIEGELCSTELNLIKSLIY